MTPQNLIDHFGGTQSAAALALDIRQALISDWTKRGLIPVAWQIVIQRKTGGVLQANLDDAERDIEFRRRAGKANAAAATAQDEGPATVQPTADGADAVSVFDAVRRTLPDQPEAP